jgi:hypothetical protein
MKALLALALVLMLSVSASATLVSLGPYTLTFDLKTPTEPTVTTKIENQNGSTLYFANIKMNNSPLVGIGITKYDDWQDATPTEHESRMWWIILHEMNKSGEIRSPALIERLIDGHRADVLSMVLTSDNKSSIQTRYWMDDKKIEGYPVSVGKTLVEIISRGTADMNGNLLNTLNITAPAETVETTDPAIVDTSTSLPGAQAVRGSDRVTYTPESDYNQAECLSHWTDLGYTETMVLNIGYCSPSY